MQGFPYKVVVYFCPKVFDVVKGMYKERKKSLWSFSTMDQNTTLLKISGETYDMAISIPINPKILKGASD